MEKMLVGDISRPKGELCSNDGMSLLNGRKHCGERRKCWLPVYSPFSSLFSKAVLFIVIIAVALLFCKGLTLYHTILTFNDPEKESF